MLQRNVRYRTLVLAQGDREPVNSGAPWGGDSSEAVFTSSHNVRWRTDVDRATCV